MRRNGRSGRRDGLTARRGGATARLGGLTAGLNGLIAGRRGAAARRRERISPSHVLITGASGAIGAALARAMRAAWPAVRLALVDREEASMRTLANELGNAETYVVDLRELDALPALVERVRARAPLDGLVNCAGVMRVQSLQSWKWDDAVSLLAIDLLAPLRLMDLVARGMVERLDMAVERLDTAVERLDLAQRSRAASGGAAGGEGESLRLGLDRSARVAVGSLEEASIEGFVVNVSSMAGRVPLRGCAYYGAAKAGLAMASEIARADLAKHGIRVVTVYPGPVKSALEAGARADYGGGGLFGRFAPTGAPRELASRIMHAIEHDEPRVVYPRLYGVGWSAPNLSRWFALAYGPPPMS
jgi:short-subunit dehydrogenase